MHSKAVAILVVMGLYFSVAAYVVPHEKVVLQINKLMIECRFDQAIASADSMARALPGDPLPKLLLLSAIGLRDMDVETPTAAALFERTCSLTVALIDTLEIKEGVSSYSKTLRGSVNGALASHYIRQTRYFNALGVGMDALEQLKKAKELEPANADVDFFMGLYNCAKSDLKKKFWWVLFWYPGGEKEGIEQLERCASKGILARSAAQLSLSDAYVRAGKYKKAKGALALLESQFGQSRFVLWSKARYFEALGQNEQAARYYAQLSQAYRTIRHGEFNALFTGLAAAKLFDKAGSSDQTTLGVLNLKGLCSQARDPRSSGLCRDIQRLGRGNTQTSGNAD